METKDENVQPTLHKASVSGRLSVYEYIWSNLHPKGYDIAFINLNYTR